MLDSIETLLLIVIVVFAFKVGSNLTNEERLRPGIFSYAIVILTATLSLLQIPLPSIYRMLSSHPGAVSQHHEYWRFITPIFVQDGGLVGTLFNLAILTIFALLAEKIMGWRWAAGIYLTGGIALTALGVATGYDGAGNSGATLVLAMSIVGLSLAKPKIGDMRLLAIASVACGLVLSFLQNAHGYAAVGGVIIGFIIGRYIIFRHTVSLGE